ncbi:transporter [Pseudomonas sp. NGC7]|uniref:transporter n=1 Tax=Pseudomonas sp. NGC7 TaxID=3341775 RepID=UPI0037DB07BD
MNQKLTRPAHRTIQSTILLLILPIGSGSAFAADVSIGTYVPMPVGANLALLYLGGGEAKEYVPEHGSKIDSGTQLKLRTGLIRLFHVLDVAGAPVQLQLGLPFGRQELKVNHRKIGSDSGLADPFVGITFWPVNNPEKKEYFGITGQVVLPLGSYDHDKSVNMGGNRYQGILQAGYSRTVGAWQYDLVGDVTVYTDNDESGHYKSRLEQSPSYTLQPWIGYNFGDKNRTKISVGLTKYFNGESQLDGVDTGRRTDSLRGRFGISTWLSPKFQVYTEVTRDIEVKGGYSFDYSGFIRLGYAF